ncbi:putative uncharacterized protein [Rhodococcus sp. AW25M09]|nr:putative uncharacterized protein [Rhodococcus sp. AW25M09]
MIRFDGATGAPDTDRACSARHSAHVVTPSRQFTYSLHEPWFIIKRVEPSTLILPLISRPRSPRAHNTPGKLAGNNIPASEPVPHTTNEKDVFVGLFDRLTRRGGPAKRGPEGSVAQYLADWTAERIGVEAYVEPKTTVTPLTVVLVANDGEWTRRPLDEKYVRKIGSDLKIPVYDVRKTGYPQRMRDHDARQKIVRKREQQQRDR